MKKPRIGITSQDAKLVLSAYRPNGADARDPFFDEALDQAKQDPQLTKWFERQRAFDDVIASKLRFIEPPTGLHSAILTGLRTFTVNRRRPVAPRLALAAVLLVAMLVLAQVWLFTPSTRDRLNEFCSDCLAQLNPTLQLDLESPDLLQTQEFIQTRQAPTAPAIPAPAATLLTAGCKTFAWNVQQVSLTCFKLPSGERLYLFVTDQKAFDDRPISTDFREIGQWHIAFQKANGVVMMWVSRASINEIKKYVWDYMDPVFVAELDF